MSRKRKISMPTYVIVEKREFEKLFETVTTDGHDLTAVNVKTSNKTKNNSRLRLLKSENPPKRRKKTKKEKECSPERRELDSKQSESRESGGEFTESVKSEIDSRDSENTSSSFSDPGQGEATLGYSSATESESE